MPSRTRANVARGDALCPFEELTVDRVGDPASGHSTALSASPKFGSTLRRTRPGRAGSSRTPSALPPKPAVALAVALVAFHGLTGKQVRELQLPDIVDGRLHLDGRDIPLAAPVMARLSAWLDDRNQAGPATANPHLLIN